MAWNSKEGTFLLSGVVIGHTKGLPQNNNNIARCGSSGSMEKITSMGYDGINGSLTKNTEVINNSDLPSVVPGFKFLKEDKCNPCVALDADYSCPFSLNVGDGGTVSPIWNTLWNI
jgi:hypothetical protein